MDTQYKVQIVSVIMSLVPITTMALDAEFKYIIQPEWFDYNEESYIDVSEDLMSQPSMISTQVLEGAFESNIVSATLAVRNKITPSGSPTVEMITKELVYRRDQGDSSFSIGRQINSMGFGNAFRPLDLVQRENLLANTQETIVGVNQIIYEIYNDLSSYGLYVLNPLNDSREDNVHPRAIILNYSDSNDSADWQALARISDDNGLQLGAGGLYVVNDSLEIHGSVLGTQQYTQMRHSLAGQSETLITDRYPWSDIDKEKALTWMIGGNFSWSGRNNLMLEYWHDDLNWSKSQWSDQLELLRLQNSLLDSQVPYNAVKNNLAWSAMSFNVHGLVQDNLFLRWSYTGERLSPEASILYSPADAGRVLNISVTMDREVLNIDVGARILDGPQDSVFGQVLQSAQYYLAVYGDF